MTIDEFFTGVGYGFLWLAAILAVVFIIERITKGPQE
jgi:hypothetical protein